MKPRHIVLVTASALAVIACDELVTDSTFDTWCGDELCHWQLETGSIERVQTWHSGDDGVELLGSPVALSQRLQPQDTEMTLRIAADLDASADVAVEIDVGDDGAIEYSNVIPAGPPWSVQSMTINLARVDPRTRLRLHKRGTGKARIGRLSLESSSFILTGLLDDFLLPCESADGCYTKVCLKAPGAKTGSCRFCASDSDCNSDRYCELESGAVWFGSCVPRPSASGCARDEECAEGMICGAKSLDQVDLSRLGSAARALLTDFGDCKAPTSVAGDYACRDARECSSGICCTNATRPISICVGERSRCSF